MEEKGNPSAVRLDDIPAGRNDRVGRTYLNAPTVPPATCTMAFLVDASVPRRASGTANTKLKIVDDGSERLSWAFFPVCRSLDASRTFAPPTLLLEFTIFLTTFSSTAAAAAAASLQPGEGCLSF
jgi:hypothetical protein